MIRLDRFLSDAGCGTRSQVKELLRRGRVSVDGTTETNPARKVDEKSTGISLDGAPVRAKGPLWLMMNKRAGCVTAARDGSLPTVMDTLAPQDRKNVFPVGRLDRDTEGLLLFTDDGEAAHRLLSPGRHVAKTYYLIGEGCFSSDAPDHFTKGLQIGDDKPTLPAVLKVLSSGSLPPVEERILALLDTGSSATGGEWTQALLTITEGRYHQVQRMAQAEGARVRYLKRISFGPLSLDDSLAPGCYRALTEAEIRRLLAQTGRTERENK